MRQVGEKENICGKMRGEKSGETKRERENEGRSRKLRRHNKRDKGGRIGAIEERRRTIGSDARW